MQIILKLALALLVVSILGHIRALRRKVEPGNWGKYLKRERAVRKKAKRRS
jgi:hypothetical protein